MGFFEKLPRFPFCCFVIDLRTGSIVIAIFLLIDYFSSLINGLANHASALYILVNIGGLILAGYLLMGVLKSKAKWIEYYLWGKLVYLVISFFLIIGVFFTNPVSAIIATLTWLLEVYFWLCVNSYYLELEGSPTVTSVVTRTTTVLTA